jgi:hypothetical protein
MSFADLASVGSFVSGAGVLVSLIYLGLQIRQNTHAVRSQIHQGLTENWLTMAAIVTDHAREFAAGLVADEKAFATMSNPDKYAFVSSIFVFFKHFENMYLQCQEGFIRRENWNARAHMMFMYWRIPGVQRWWGSRREASHPNFGRSLSLRRRHHFPRRRISSATA